LGRTRNDLLPEPGFPLQRRSSGEQPEGGDQLAEDLDLPHLFDTRDLLPGVHRVLLPVPEDETKADPPMISEKKIQRTLWVLILTSLVIRSVVAGIVEFGNDEVYYWTYARFPALSHFDHPPMVGWVIQLFTLNLLFTSEFFIRLGAVVFGAINTYLIFRIGKKIRDSLTGLYAAFLFTGSLYCSVISGIFIMPDTPQVLFWLMTLYLLVSALPDRELSRDSRKKICLAGMTIGLAMLSKYHSVFLLAGAFLYILFFNRKWLKAKETWLAFLIVIVLFLPVVIWNRQNAFISFTFHESRVDYVKPGIRWDYFLAEMGGEFFYNNPVNVILILFSLVAIIRGRKFIGRDNLWILLFVSLPLALVFQGFSLYRSTLPHWTGPAYLGFILIAASWLSRRNEKPERKKLLPVPVILSVSLFLLVIILGTGQINGGWVKLGRHASDDFSVQLYGWRQLGEKADKVLKKDAEERRMSATAPLLSFRWFPAANLDYYVAAPAGRKVYAIGTLERIHKYYWINGLRGDLKKGSDAYYIGISDQFADPKRLYSHLYDSIAAPDTIRICRGKEQIREAYVYRLYGLKKDIPFSRRDHYQGIDPARIRFFEKQIRADTHWMQMVKKKAVEMEVPLQEQVTEEAIYMANQEGF
jgi:hypothetical protein